MRFSKKLSTFRCIDSHAPKPAANPYRQILRRHVPEPLLALLVFVMGVWLWNNHFGPAIAYDQQTCRMALLKIDRDLRLAEATDQLPPLLRSALAIESRQAALKTAVYALDVLGAENALDEEGKYALAILEALRRGINPAQGTFLDLGLPGPPEVGAVIRRIANGEDPWWDREYLKQTGRLSTGAAAVATWGHGRWPWDLASSWVPIWLRSASGERSIW